LKTREEWGLNASPQTPDASLPWFGNQENKE